MAKKENLKRTKTSSEEGTPFTKKLKKVKKIEGEIKQDNETKRDLLTEDKESHKVQKDEGEKQTDGHFQGKQYSKTDPHVKHNEKATVDKSVPLESRLIAMSNETVPESVTGTGFSSRKKCACSKESLYEADIEVDEAYQTNLKKSRYKTTTQQVRGDKKKQKRKEKFNMVKEKGKTVTKAEQKPIINSSTENVLWKKLKQVRKAPVIKMKENVRAKPKPEKAFVSENVSEVVEEEDPIKKAIREKKREKRRRKKAEKQRIRQENLERAGTAGPAAIEYLHTWDRKREEWKFMKVRQVWLMKNMYDSEQVNDDDFEILLRYLEPTNSRTKETLVEEAEEVIKNIEDEVVGSDEEDTGGVVTNYKMDRARQIIQLLAV